MKTLWIKSIMIFVLMIECTQLMAQEIITVSGKIQDITRAGWYPESFFLNESVYIFAFNNIEAAKESVKKLESGGPINPDQVEIAEPDGSYEIEVAKKGALVIRANFRTQLVEVKNNNQIDINIDGGIGILVDFVEPRPYLTTTAPSKVGDKLIVDNWLIIPYDYGASDRRLIIQPYITDCNSEEIVVQMTPIVLEGEKYSNNKKLNKKAKEQIDTLDKYIDKLRYLTDGMFILPIHDTAIIPDINRNYRIHAKLTIQDKEQTTYEDTLKLSTCKTKNPLLFLEYPFNDYTLEANKYPEDTLANQLAEYIRNNNYKEADIIANKLPDNDKYKLIKAFAKCIGGYYDYRSASTTQEREKRKQAFELVKNSSPINNVVMCMAMNTNSYNLKARKALGEIKPTILTKYMKLQLILRRKKYNNDPFIEDFYLQEDRDFVEAAQILDTIIKKEPKFKNIAQNDGELSEKFMEWYADPYNWNILF